jgi:hypothetical protein
MYQFLEYEVDIDELVTGKAGDQTTDGHERSDFVCG